MTTALQRINKCNSSNDSKFPLLLFLLPAILLGIFSSTSYGQVSDRVIEQSRHKGMDYLKSQQLKDGSWTFDKHEVGITALCTLALLENGVPETDPIIEKGMRFIRKNTKDLTQTYDLALTVLLLSRTGNRKDRALIRTLSARLIAGQCTSGGWTYSCPKVSSLIFTNPERRPKPKKSPGDNSCTQFAVLGLWAASRTGIKIEDAMTNVAFAIFEKRKTKMVAGDIVFPKILISTLRKKKMTRSGKIRGKSIETRDKESNHNKQQQQTLLETQ